MTELHPTSPQKPIAVTLILSGVVAGTLDILSAFIINPKVPPLVILKYIASAVLGGDAFAGGTDIVYCITIGAICTQLLPQINYCFNLIY